MELPATVYIALGAIAAAFITGAFSFVNLIIAKDQKTSGFRQDWIDRLRDDISVFTSQVESVSAMYNFALRENPNILQTSTEYEKFVNSISPNLREIANMHHRIKLRLNPKEHEVLIGLVSEINGIFRDIMAISDFDRVETLIANVIEESQIVLKREWKRVKRGEIGFVLTKYGALLFFVAMLLLVVAYVQGWLGITFGIPVTR
ncbi:MAG: hypothetical protein V1685_05815 [Parcubacteria group bacterium]